MWLALAQVVADESGDLQSLSRTCSRQGDFAGGLAVLYAVALSCPVSPRSNGRSAHDVE